MPACPGRSNSARQAATRPRCLSLAWTMWAGDCAHAPQIARKAPCPLLPRASCLPTLVPCTRARLGPALPRNHSSASLLPSPTQNLWLDSSPPQHLHRGTSSPRACGLAEAMCWGARAGSCGTETGRSRVCRVAELCGVRQGLWNHMGLRASADLEGAPAGLEPGQWQHSAWKLLQGCSMTHGTVQMAPASSLPAPGSLCPQSPKHRLGPFLRTPQTHPHPLWHHRQRPITTWLSCLRTQQSTD